MSCKTKKPVHSEARNIIKAVIDFFDQQKAAGVWRFPLENATELAAAATGKSCTFIKKLRSEVRKSESGVLNSPSKKSRSGGANKIVLDDFELSVLRRTVHEVYAVDKKVPTLKVLVERMKDKVGFIGGRETLRNYLLQIGFKFKKCHDRRKFLMERPDVVAWRSQYLHTLRNNDALLENRRPVTFLDETYIHPSYGVSKCWQSEDEPGIYKTDRAGHRHIIVHAGGSYGFVNNGLLIFKSNTKSGNYHDEMNHANFMQWVKSQLIPNLPPNGIVVLDNAPYHSVQINKPPTQSERKQVIRDWLCANGIPIVDDMLKAELVVLLKQHRPPIKKYYVDEILKEHGHTVLRLPPYHCDLNPIELIWSLVKHKVAMNNISQSSTEIEGLVRQAFAEISQLDWEKQVKHVDRLREEFWQRDGLLDTMAESVTFTVNTGSSDEDSFSDSGSD